MLTRTPQVTVKNVQQSRVLVALESGLRGVITKEDFSDRGGEAGYTLLGRVQPNQLITARVLQVRHLESAICGLRAGGRISVCQ